MYNSSMFENICIIKQTDRRIDRQTDRLVLEHFGRCGKKAESYLDDLSKRSRNDFGRSNRTELKTTGDLIAKMQC